MKIEQIYTGCLAEAAYYIESEGEVAIIDPLREVAPYIEKAAQANAKIKYVFETHFHADFVSGHIDLAKKTGAKIVFGPEAVCGYDCYSATDGEVFKIGKITITVLHTPGHTFESSTFLLKDEAGKDIAIFTGDTLFIGDVGRPDLAIKGNYDQVALAKMLYNSLQTKIMPLADDVIVYPAHGAGSACGKNMSKETFDTLGNQKATNYALKAKSEEEFVKEVLSGLNTPPQYFPKNAMMNKMGYDSIDQVMQRGAQALSPAAFEAAANETRALLLDVRNPQDFAKGFIPNSINIGLNGQFAPWVGALITDLKQEILLIAPEDKESEAVMRLARVGYDHTIGYLKGGVDAWKAAGFEVDTIKSISAEEFSDILKNEEPAVLDARKESEYQSEHINSELVQNFPLDFVNSNMQQLDKDKEYHIHCAGGYRSMILASILKSRGFDKVIDVAGGFGAIKKTEKFELTNYVCPTTLL